MKTFYVCHNAHILQSKVSNRCEQCGGTLKPAVYVEDLESLLKERIKELHNQSNPMLATAYDGYDFEGEIQELESILKEVQGE